MTQVVNDFLLKIGLILGDINPKIEYMLDENATNVIPFLKWAGGKRQLSSVLEKHIPQKFNDYYEPFLGGGSFYFLLKNKGFIKNKSFLGDLNVELINTYACIMSNYERVLNELDIHKINDSKEYFYEIRGLDRLSGFEKTDLYKKAARFIYLNKTCFNGIWRTNKQGQNNVPYGNRKSPGMYDLNNIKGVSQYLNEGTILVSGSFEQLLLNSKKGDFIFLDPPYNPYNKATGFTTYNGARFGEDMQEKVYTIFCELDKRGCYVMLTNNATDYIKNLYSKYNNRSLEVDVKRLVNSNGAKRNAVKEIIIKNY